MQAMHNSFSSYQTGRNSSSSKALSSLVVVKILLQNHHGCMKEVFCSQRQDTLHASVTSHGFFCLLCFNLLPFLAF